MVINILNLQSKGHFLLITYSIALVTQTLPLADTDTNLPPPGGRDLKGTAAKPKNLRTAPQSRDQCLSRGNAALVRSADTKRPLRVIRGFKSRSVFAPEEGYRYDGEGNVLGAAQNLMALEC